MSEPVPVQGAIDMCGSELLSLPEGVRKVASFLGAQGHPHQPLMLDGVAQRARDVFLARHFRESLRPPLAGDNLIGHK